MRNALSHLDTYVRKLTREDGEAARIICGLITPEKPSDGWYISIVYVSSGNVIVRCTGLTLEAAAERCVNATSCGKASPRPALRSLAS